LHDAQGILDVDANTFGDCSYAAEQILAIEADPRQRAWVAEENGQIVGFVSAFATHSLEADRWEIDELAVHPAHQGRGIGTQLVACAVEDGAVPPDLSQARTLIARANIASQRAFAKSRFAPVARVDLLLYQVSGRVPRPPEPGLPTVRLAGDADVPAVAELGNTSPSRVAKLIAHPDNTYLITTGDNTPLSCGELIHVRTLQYEGTWLESLTLTTSDRQVARALFRAAIEMAKRTPEMDRVGYLAPPGDREVYEACVREGFSWVDEYLTFVQEIGAHE
jgi:GNAT superfamily N-acetyltransferase